MKIDADWLNEAGLQSILLGLTNAGHQALVVGGCVRNTLMGRTISDVDVATSALPQDLSTIAQSLGFRAVPTGIEHGTVTVVSDTNTYEVTTFRKDVQTDGRRASVQFTADVTGDAARRDFTINAVYADASGTIIDPLGGIADIAQARVRFVGNAAARICEDYLRILRYFRFSAIYADPAHGFDAETLAICAAHQDGIDLLSRERVGQEMRKLLAAHDPAPALGAMAQTGILTRILAGAQMHYIAPLVHLEAGHPCGWTARLVLLGGADAENALRLSRAETAELQKLRIEIEGTLTAAALGWRHGEDLGRAALHARAAMMEQVLPENWHSELTRGTNAVCPVTAADFMPRFSGPHLGHALARATTAWLNSDLNASKADLI